MLRRQRRRCTESSTRACDFGSCPWTRTDGSLDKEPSSPQPIAYCKTPRRSRIKVTPSRPRANAAVCPAGARELHNASARRARVSAPSAHGIGLRHARARRSRYRQHATEKHDALNAERLATAQSANCRDIQNCAERKTLVKDWESRIDAACRRTASPASLQTAPCPPKYSTAQSASCRSLKNCAEREINVMDREDPIDAACRGASPSRNFRSSAVIPVSQPGPRFS